MSIAEGFVPFAVWEQDDLACFVPPHPDREQGRWVTIRQLRDLFAVHGPSYVEHFQRGWVTANHAAAHEAMEASLHQRGTALDCGDLAWAKSC